MQRLLCIVFVLFSCTLYAKTFYISATGDNTDGLTPATAWRTIAKLNASFDLVSPGDSILFNSGETFYGSIEMGQSGTAAYPIVISSYGSGQKPIISGFSRLTGWTKLSGNIWQCDAPELKNNVNILTVDNVPYAVGRTPNASYYTYQSATATQLTSNALTGTPSYVGAEIVIKKTRWKAEKASITAQTGSTVTYIPTLPIDNNSGLAPTSGIAGYGYFLQRFPASLDQFGEWYFDSTTKKMQFYSTVNPSAYLIKASYVDTVILLNSKSNILVSNLAIEGGGMYGLESYAGTNVIVKNCSFNNNTRAVYIWNTNDAVVDGNTINNSFNVAIIVSNNQRKRMYITNNKVRNTGLLLGMGLFWSDYNLKAVVARTDTTTASNYIFVTGNTVINSGQTGIQFQGSNVTVRRNVIDSFISVLDDAGGIYTYTNNQTLNTQNFRNRLIDSNFISNAIGAPDGANGTIDVCGYYLDDQAANITGLHNTIFNIPGTGIQMNTPHDNIMRDNTVYNTNLTMVLSKRHVAEVYNNVLKANILYQKDSSQFNFLHTNDNLTLPTSITIAQSLTNIANIDSNWITNMKNAAYQHYYSPTGGAYTFPPNWTLATWRQNYLHDVHSVLPPVTVTPTNTTFEYNPSYTQKTVLFIGRSKIDPKGRVYDNSVTVPKWSSIVLIDNGPASSANLSPVATAGGSISITSPISTTTITGSGTDSDGTISSYGWVQVSGPSTATIANPAAASTTISNLVRGVYQFEITVTDNNGATGRDWQQVIVNQAPTANAGFDKLITLPINTVALAGAGTDLDGIINAYSWAQISGPSPATIVISSIAAPDLFNLVQGVYQFELTVTDNDGGTGKDIVKITVNRPPVANAGPDKLINLPANNTTLTGSGSDADGTVSSYAWTKISGPASGTIASPAAATTAVNNLEQGVYQYQLTVTDNRAAPTMDTVQVTVNQPPTANAGPAQLINLPVNTISLAGSGTDVDGSIISYAWAKTSGPASGTIENPADANSAVSNLSQGIYQFELTVTDNNGATAKATVQVTVNQSPVANAGSDQLITLPLNTASLTGSGSDPDGTIVSYSWLKVSGPASGTIANANTANAQANNLERGIYQFELTVTDNNGGTGKATITVTVNQPPAVNAGPDQLISLPVNTVSLAGSGTDPDGTIISSNWVKISGPSSGTIADQNNVNTLVNDLVQGVYKFELTLTDNLGATGKASVQITVNQPPASNAGSDQSITLPENSVSLTGTGTDTDGTIVSYAWLKVSGPAGGTIANPNDANTLVNNLGQGIYQFELSVTDNSGATSKNTVTVTVFKAPNKLPVANAGVNMLITLPVNSVMLNGSGTDPDGDISSYTWEKISGPASGTIANPNAANTSLNNLAQGIYHFELTVTDNEGATAKASVQVTVNQPPVVNAGSDVLISLPINYTTLNGNATDADGDIISYAWSKISGPANGTIATPNAATTDLTSLAGGIYQFQLTVTDNSGATGTDIVQVTVNQAPLANAGADKLINLPTNTTTLTGTATDADGTIASYAWSKLSGPANGTIATPNAATTDLTSLAGGVYQFQLTVTDNSGAIGTDIVQVTVNQAPVANAGLDKLINLPTNTTTLAGTATDADGTIASYVWSKLSGPANGTIATPNAATTDLTSLAGGVYQFQLTVTDNSGAIGTDIVQVTVNQAPLANAGADKLINLPTNTTTLTGTATDADGTIATYVWSKLSGPANGTIVTPNAATTDLTSLAGGVYQFQLTVTDNSGAIGTDIVQVTVNQAPVANAGLDKLINLPTNTTTLAGTATDADGTIASYVWSKLSGPANGTIATPNAATTDLTSLAGGVYQFQLTVTDNSGATGTDIVQVTVNQAPIANAGLDKLINLPTNTTTLTGTATDADGTILSYVWSKLSGPANGTIATPNAATTNLTSLTGGTYQFQLTVTDNSGATGTDIVQVTVNQAPVANAGLDKLINLPTNTTTLAGTATDADGTIASYAWSKLSGPANGTITTPNAATTDLTSLAGGVYQFQLTVTDNSGATGTDIVQVTVNQAPLANAGVDKLINLPTNTTTLTGTATDADGTIATYVWSKLSGPANGTIVTPNAATTDLTSLAGGVYQFQLTVTDNSGAIGSDIVQVTVNQAPLANAGADKLINLPTNTTTLTGTATDADGTIASYVWSKLSGPANGTIATPNAATTDLTSLAGGVYQFQLTVTDNSGAIGTDIVQVTVNQAPLANAGVDKLINLPITTTTLIGSATDADGTIASYAWSKISGPANGTFLTPNAATTDLTSLAGGVYQFQLTVTDNSGATGTDIVQVTVNQAPLANAGADKLINLPINTTTLTGTATDADGTIASYAWSKISGPANGTISTPNAATTDLTSLAGGVYQFQLTVTDNSGAIGTDIVQVTVNQAPLANAGVDKLINLPTNTTTLTGTATDADGTIASYAWSKLSGPANGTIATPNAATTNLTGLAGGVYQFQLTVTDNSGATGTDIVQVTVNQAPLANAGADKLINLPTNTTTLTGTATDADGTIVSYAWSKISGPANGTIATPNAATTDLTSLAGGVYQFQLTVTDNSGATGTDIVQVTVNQAPLANAGADKLINLPTNTTTLTGTATDADGTIASYAWSKLSGPANGTISTPKAATTDLTSLAGGVYQFQLNRY